MERIFNFFLSLVLAASCAAFGSPANSGGAPLPENGAGSSAVSGSDQNSGVQSTPEGNTPVPKRAAGFWSPISPPPELRKLLPSPLNADLFEILPEHPYTAADLDYNSDCRTNTE